MNDTRRRFPSLINYAVESHGIIRLKYREQSAQGLEGGTIT